MNRFLILVTVFLTSIALSACGGQEASETPAPDPTDSDLSLEAQIGPITHVELGEIDPDMVAAGEKAFTLRCTACHQMEASVVGPPLGGILDNRSPEYVMNMILNPTEMLARHPDAIAQLEEYAVPMADLGVSEEDARAILEYLR